MANRIKRHKCNATMYSLFAEYIKRNYYFTFYCNNNDKPASYWVCKIIIMILITINKTMFRSKHGQPRNLKIVLKKNRKKFPFSAL